MPHPCTLLSGLGQKGRTCGWTEGQTDGRGVDRTKPGRAQDPAGGKWGTGSAGSGCQSRIRSGGIKYTHIHMLTHSYTHSRHTQIHRHSRLPTGPWWPLSSPFLPMPCSALRAWHPLPRRTEPMRTLPTGDLPGRGRPAQLLSMSQRRRARPSGCPQRVGVWRWVRACGGMGGTGTPKPPSSW